MGIKCPENVYSFKPQTILIAHRKSGEWASAERPTKANLFIVSHLPRKARKKPQHCERSVKNGPTTMKHMRVRQKIKMKIKKTTVLPLTLTPLRIFSAFCNNTKTTTTCLESSSCLGIDEWVCECICHLTTRFSTSSTYNHVTSSLSVSSSVSVSSSAGQQHYQQH